MRHDSGRDESGEADHDDQRSVRRASKRARSPPAAAAVPSASSSSGPAAPVPDVKLSDEDYYSRAKEFRAWLVVAGKPKFGDLPGPAARKLFEEFFGLWNAGGLPREYYDGTFDADLADSGRTSFRWAFAGKMPSEDKDALLRIRDTVQAETDKEATLLDAMSVARAAAARKQRKREAWERHEAERQAKDRAEYETAVKTSQATVAAAAADAASISAKPAPTASDLMESLGIKPGQVVTMKPRQD